jgi:hypothetical protein
LHTSLENFHADQFIDQIGDGQAALSRDVAEAYGGLGAVAAQAGISESAIQ